METCYKMMTREVVDRLDLESKRFGIEPEITCKVARMRARIFEVPISYSGRTYEEGKKIGLKDAFQAVWVILKYFPLGGAGRRRRTMTLRRMASLAPYNRWLHERFERHLGSRVLEVGSGVGNQTRWFIDKERVVASDIESHYVRELRANFGSRSNVRVASFRFPLSDADRADLRRREDRHGRLPERPRAHRGRRRDRARLQARPAGRGRLVLLVRRTPRSTARST